MEVFLACFYLKELANINCDWLLLFFWLFFSDGKEAMMSGAAAFNKAANTSYANLPVRRKGGLKT